MKANVSSKRERKDKRKRKGKEISKAAALCLETQARSEGYMAKTFKAWCPKPTGWEPSTLCSLHGWMGGF